MHSEKETTKLRQQIRHPWQFCCKAAHSVWEERSPPLLRNTLRLSRGEQRKGDKLYLSSGTGVQFSTIITMKHSAPSLSSSCNVSINCELFDIKHPNVLQSSWQAKWNPSKVTQKHTLTKTLHSELPIHFWSDCKAARGSAGCMNTKVRWRAG